MKPIPELGFSPAAGPSRRRGLQVQYGMSFINFHNRKQALGALRVDYDRPHTYVEFEKFIVTGNSIMSPCDHSRVRSSTSYAAVFFFFIHTATK